MKIATNGIVVNESGKVLLIQRDDTKTFAPPGGSIEAGELPTENIAREVREETGLIVMPVRLVGVYFASVKPEGMLNFVFRCIQRGGELARSAESLQVGYFWPKELPQPMLKLHRERLYNGLNHAGGPPHWSEHKKTIPFQLMGLWLKWVVYPRLDRQRMAQGQSVFIPAPQWQVSASVIIRRNDGKLYWRKVKDQWRLPGGIGNPMEPPWVTAVRHTKQQTGQSIQLTNLTGVYIHSDKPEMTFAFTADGVGASKADAAWFQPGKEPDSVRVFEKTAVQDAISASDETIFANLKL